MYGADIGIRAQGRNRLGRISTKPVILIN